MMNVSTRMFQLLREGSFNPISIPKTPLPHDLPANTLSNSIPRSSMAGRGPTDYLDVYS